MEDNEFRDLQERTQLVSEMAQHPGWELLLDRARVSLFKRQQRLISGRILDFEEYLRETSWMDGLSFLMDLPATIQNELDYEVAIRAEREAEDEDE